MTTARRSLPRALALTALTVLAVVPAAGPASAAPAAPQLSITVDDGQTDVSAGSTLRYVVTVTNLGTTAVRDLAVSQTLPPGTTLTAVDSDGTKTREGARWTVDVAGGRTVTLRTTVDVADALPPDLLRLAAVTCAATSAKAAPTVCASDSDQLPAGAAAAEQQRQVETGAAAAAGQHRVLPAAAALGGLAVALVLAVVLAGRRRRRSRPAEHLGLARRGAGGADAADAPSSAPEVLRPGADAGGGRVR